MILVTKTSDQTRRVCVFSCTLSHYNSASSGEPKKADAVPKLSNTCVGMYFKIIHNLAIRSCRVYPCNLMVFRPPNGGSILVVATNTSDDTLQRECTLSTDFLQPLGVSHPLSTSSVLPSCWPLLNSILSMCCHAYLCS